MGWLDMVKYYSQHMPLEFTFFLPSSIVYKFHTVGS